MSTVINFERPGFIATSALIAEEVVCILTPAAATDVRIQERVRRLMKGQGIDCRLCGGCPVGRAQ